jgi:hypothetical protein
VLLYQKLVNKQLKALINSFVSITVNNFLKTNRVLFCKVLPFLQHRVDLDKAARKVGYFRSESAQDVIKAICLKLSERDAATITSLLEHGPQRATAVEPR